MRPEKTLAIALWEAVSDIDKIDETPFAKVPGLLDALCAKLVRAAIDAEATSESSALAAENERLRHALKMISIVEQGCGGTLSFQQMAESAMRQAKEALASIEGNVNA